MEAAQTKKNEILHNAEILMWKSELLIQSCDNWLSPEEGLKNVEKRIEERNKVERTEKWRNRKMKLLQVFRNL